MKGDSDSVDSRYRVDIYNLKTAEINAEDLVDELGSLGNKDVADV